ncbi:MAG: hypothetical protein Fur0022_22690 [Anaerolineales bacterium]
MNHCCLPADINDLDNKFDRGRAEKEACAYLEIGPGKRIEKMLAFFHSGSAQPCSVLDIGCGVGGAHFELLRNGLAREAVGVEASTGYIFEAEKIANALSLEAQVRYQRLDFAQGHDGIGPADVVILGRVICCYPHLEPLLAPAAERARQYLVLSTPREGWGVRFYEWVINGIRRLLKSKFFTFIHPHAEIRRITAEKGLGPVFQDRTGSWQLMVFARQLTQYMVYNNLPDCLRATTSSMNPHLECVHRSILKPAASR